MSDTQTPATSGQGAAASTTTPTPANTDPFFSGFTNAEVKQWVEAKGFKSPEALAESGWNLEKLLGHDRAGRTVVLPKDESDTAAYDAIWNRLGRPEKPEDYQFSVPEGQPRDFADKAAKKLHELGLDTKRARALNEWWNSEVAESQKALEAAATAEADRQLNQLKVEWGGAFDERANVARAAAKEFFGLDAEKMTAIENQIGTKAFMEAMYGLGAKLGEGRFVNGQGGDTFATMTPAMAAQEIQNMRLDKDFMAAYLDSSHLGHKAAVEKFTKLHEIMAANRAT